jgi:hypothetical protein
MLAQLERTLPRGEVCRYEPSVMRASIHMLMATQAVNPQRLYAIWVTRAMYT